MGRGRHREALRTRVPARPRRGRGPRSHDGRHAGPDQEADENRGGSRERALAPLAHAVDRAARGLHERLPRRAPKGRPDARGGDREAEGPSREDLTKRTSVRSRQNIVLSFEAFSGTSCITSQCSTIFPCSSRKMSMTAVPRAPGEGTNWLWTATRSPSANRRLKSTRRPGIADRNHSMPLMNPSRPSPTDGLCWRYFGPRYFVAASSGLRWLNARS